ncbi:MAG: DUF1499 domain-containing protein [Pseudazoarcus pumilus]|nr:DUF1499 domain-containing protein [Pseudazoarcus pumilus]
MPKEGVVSIWWLAGAMLLLPVVGMAGYWLHAGLTHPVINDVVTDPTLPLDFRAMPVAVPYPGEAFAEKQRAAYPEVQPLHLDATPQLAYDAALRLINERGWQVAMSEPARGRIEAIARSRIFRFADEIAVQLTPAPDGVRVDVRSRSRVGRSDLGVNAARVRLFLQDLQQSLPAA